MRSNRSQKRSDKFTLFEVSTNRTPLILTPLDARHSQIVWFGMICAVGSAVGYTAANICLRTVSDCDPIWVSCVKSLPTVVFIGLWLVWKVVRGNRLIAKVRVIGALILAGLFGQIAGNVAFQWSLGIIGIAISVPLLLGTMIVSGAILGRMFLNESVTKQMVTSMAILILAICVLSVGARKASESVRAEAEQSTRDFDQPTNWILLPLGIAAASCSGFAYAVLGIVIRYAVLGRASIAATLFTVGIVGAISLGLWSWFQIGVEGMLATTGSEWIVMFQAGVYNAIAFLALTKALQLTTVVFVNAVSASQTAMAAIAGVLVFQETPTIAMWSGVALMVFGLLLMKSNSASKMPEEAC